MCCATDSIPADHRVPTACRMFCDFYHSRRPFRRTACCWGRCLDERAPKGSSISSKLEELQKTVRQASSKRTVQWHLILPLLGNIDPYPVMACWLSVPRLFTRTSNILKHLLTVHIGEGDSHAMIHVYRTLQQVVGSNFDLPGKEQAICRLV